VSYVSGKFIYTADAHPGENTDEDSLLNLKIGLEIPPHIRIQRLDPGNGRVLWQHYQKRAPLDVGSTRTRSNCSSNRRCRS